MNTIKEIYRSMDDFGGQEIEVSGWIRTMRVSKNFGFIELNDGTFFKNLQVVFENDLDNFEEISHYAIATAISVRGTLVLTPDSKQPFELKTKTLTLEGPSQSDYPLQKKRHSFEYLRTIAHLRPRGNTYNALFRVRSMAAFAIHKFFNERDFVYVHTPIISGSDAEGAGEMFQVTTLDLNDVPKNDQGKPDLKKDFLVKKLTSPYQVNCKVRLTP